MTVKEALELPGGYLHLGSSERANHDKHLALLEKMKQQGEV
jgi:hypothetical protein